jgi:iron-sulfur cluster repair protein YtfE (RIC family)
MTTLGKLSPSITRMIRLDHAHALSTFHGYTTDASQTRKKAIADVLCTALEVHAQLEEEIFYPALRQVASGNPALEKARPEHDEMRSVITRLRAMSPSDAAYDETVSQLMRDVIHHVADEETVLLPLAERLLADRLGELGAEMTKRRIALVGPKAPQLALDHAKAMPMATALIAGGALAAGLLLKKSFSGGRSTRWH